MEKAINRDQRIGWAVLMAAALIFIGCKKADPAKSAAPEVAVAQVEQRDVPITHEWVGTLDGFVNAQIRQQVTGYLLRQTYQ